MKLEMYLKDKGQIQGVGKGLASKGGGSVKHSARIFIIFNTRLQFCTSFKIYRSYSREQGCRDVYVNGGGTTLTRPHHGWRRAGKILKIGGSLRSPEMTISEFYPPLSVPYCSIICIGI